MAQRRFAGSVFETRAELFVSFRVSKLKINSGVRTLLLSNHSEESRKPGKEEIISGRGYF